MFLFVLVRVAVMVVLELFTTLLIYIYLATYQRDFFGSLIGFADGVLTASIKPTLALFPELERQANLTVLGELAPKAMLLLLIGLTVGAIFRLLGWMFDHFLLRNGR